MQISKCFQISKACSKDTTRPHISNVYLNVEEKLAVATDGHFLACVPVMPGVNDTTGLVPVDAVNAAQKMVGKKSDAELTCTDNVTLQNGASYPRPTETFPPYKQVLPDYNNQKTLEIALTPQYLMDLCAALGIDKGGCVVLRFPEPIDSGHGRGLQMLDPILVRPDKANGAYGVLMPCKITR